MLHISPWLLGKRRHCHITTKILQARAYGTSQPTPILSRAVQEESLRLHFTQFSKGIWNGDQWSLCCLCYKDRKQSSQQTVQTECPPGKSAFGYIWVRISLHPDVLSQWHSLISRANKQSDTGRSSRGPLSSFSSSKMDCEHLSRSEHEYHGQCFSTVFYGFF